MKAVLGALILAFTILPSCLAKDDTCPQCKQACSCHKVCRYITEIKKVPEPTYCCKCEDICLPGPGKYCGVERVPDPSAPGGFRCVPSWQPNCGKIINQRKLVKTIVMVEKPVYRCVVETVCTQCGCVRPDSHLGPAPGILARLASSLWSDRCPGSCSDHCNGNCGGGHCGGNCTASCAENCAGNGRGTTAEQGAAPRTPQLAVAPNNADRTIAPMSSKASGQNPEPAMVPSSQEPAAAQGNAGRAAVPTHPLLAAPVAVDRASAPIAPTGPPVQINEMIEGE